jgi:NAD(P)-dependent dehydrogenase (short-subunit alcohol dehydrogenase family)
MGHDFALRLLAEGYIVYAAARRVERMQDIADRGGHILSMDVTDDASISAGVEQMLAESGRIDVLVNAAGYGQYGAIEDVPLDLGRRQFEVNLFGLARVTQLCLPHMRDRSFGRIVNISSIGGRITTPLGGWYHASKFALEGWSDTLRNEVRAFGIEVIVIEPGGVESEWNDIATKEAQRISGNGPYRALVESFVRVRSKMRQAPPPSVISDLLIEAVKSKRPQTRYVGGQMAKPLLFLRRWLPDRTFDRVIMSAFR